jgi:trimeric autotransporter adhesin
MKNIFLILGLSLLVNAAFGQQKIRIHNSGNTLYAKEITAVDSIQFDNTLAKFRVTGEPNTLNIPKKDFYGKCRRA